MAGTLFPEPESCGIISQLPPELFRRGRFDELFFVDLPNPPEREEIISLYIRKYRLPPVSPALLAELVAASRRERAVAASGQPITDTSQPKARRSVLI